MGAPIGLSPRPQALTPSGPSQKKPLYRATAVQPAQKSSSVAKSKAVRFGSGPGSVLRKASAGVLGGLSFVIGTVAAPLGLLQLAAGCIPALHFLWLTGLLTLAVPVLGGVGTFMLWPSSKKT